MLKSEMDEWFKFHPPKDEVALNTHAAIRMLCGDLADKLYDMLPDSPERTAAIEKVREAMFYANAAVACHQ